MSHRSPILFFNRPHTTRRGTLLVEMVVCTVLLSVMAAILVPGIRGIHRQRKSTRFETLAIIELNSLAARLTEQQDTAAIELSQSFSSRYPDARLQVTPGAPDEADMQPVQLTVTNPAGLAIPDLKRTLTTWILMTSPETQPAEEPSE